MFSIKEYNILKSVFDDSLKDRSDILNSIITTTIFIIFVSITSLESYFLTPITCFSPNLPLSSNLDRYVESYCWVHGTIDLKNDKTPQTDAEWSKKRIGYYQWIPFLLLIQCALFYIPSLIWRIACRNNHGTDLTIILKRAKQLAEDYSEPAAFDKILKTLEDLFFTHRDFRQNLMSQISRKVHKRCKFIFSSKRLGNKLSLSYLFIKVLYLLNVVAQVFLMKSVLGIDSWTTEVFTSFYRLMWMDDDLAESKYFPRVTFCRVRGIRSVGVMDNSYVAQCVLTVNMLNVKIFIFLFVWVSVVFVVTFYWFLKWLRRLGSTNLQVKQVKTYLKMRMAYKKMDQLVVKRFVEHFLRMDGIFLLHMIEAHAGDVVTSMITNGLYEIFYKKYRDQNFTNDKLTEENDSLSLKLEPGGRGSVKTHFVKPSAPEKKFLL